MSCEKLEMIDDDPVIFLFEAAFKIFFQQFSTEAFPMFNHFQLCSTPNPPILQVLDIHSHQGGCPLIGETMALRSRYPR